MRPLSCASAPPSTRPSLSRVPVDPDPGGVLRVPVHPDLLQAAALESRRGHLEVHVLPLRGLAERHLEGAEQVEHHAQLRHGPALPLHQAPERHDLPRPGGHRDPVDDPLAAHINNVNGFRYLSYSFTCPLMQAELILLIVPAVPCYKLQMILVMIVTWAVMITGWYASSLEGALWTTDWQDVFLDGNFDNLTFKGKAVFPSMAGVLALSMVQMPYMWFLYNCYGGRAEMPEGMNSMIVLTAISWLGFPIRWFLSFEGASIIEDTKLNGLGFPILNMVSKGGFTLKMISMVKQFKRKQMLLKQQAQQRQPRVRSGSVASLYSLPDLPSDQQLQQQQNQHQRQDRTLPTGQSMADFIKAMKPFDGEGDNEFAQKEFEPEKEPLKPTRGSELKNEDLVAEFLKRMDMNKAMAFSQAADPPPVHMKSAACLEQKLNAQIQAACSKFIIEESD